MAQEIAIQGAAPAAVEDLERDRVAVLGAQFQDGNRQKTPHLAAELGAVSADHLLKSSPADLDAMAVAGTVYVNRGAAQALAKTLHPLMGRTISQFKDSTSIQSGNCRSLPF